MAKAFFAGLPKLPSKRCWDLLRIAAGVYATDRLSKRIARGDSNQHPACFELEVEVHDIDFWAHSEVALRITEVLEFLTDEIWQFRFRPIDPKADADGHQHPLQFSGGPRPSRLALYSGGLDSAAGLANRLLEGVNDFLLMTVCHQSRLRKNCALQLDELWKALDIAPIPHATLVTSLRGGGSIRLRDQECAQRTRAFLFVVSAVAAASTLDIAEIEVFENGVGSINFPLMTWMLVGGLATRGAHPTFLQLISGLATQVAGYPIRLTLPFANATKGEMLVPLRENGLAAWTTRSRSCIHSSWRIAGKTHCGSCPACIERRQAFAVNGVAGNDDFTMDIFGQLPRSQAEIDYFRIYRAEARAWLAGEPGPRRRMDAHLRMTGVPEEEHPRVSALQTRHSMEVAHVFI